jgi:Rrf2 family nitric oxide-sensitive transcriptional repressor
MRLAEYTDYTLRVLMYCATHPERLVTIAELAEQHSVSKNHLMKIVNDLAHQGVLETTRGRGGGLHQQAQPADILVECFDGRTNVCTLTPSCRLKGVLHSALKAYFAELDAVTLADIAAPAPQLRAPKATRGAGASAAVAPPVSRRRKSAKLDA